MYGETKRKNDWDGNVSWSIIQYSYFMLEYVLLDCDNN